MDSTRRTLLWHRAPRAFAQTAARFYEKGNVRIHYQEAGSGFPLLIIPGGGQNSTISYQGQDSPGSAPGTHLPASASAGAA